MKKLFLVLISFLLLAGVAQAVETNQAITSELTAQNNGRSVATDSSVVLKVWVTPGTLTYPGVGASASSVIKVYNNYVTGTGFTLNTGDSALDTIGEVVDYINTNLSSDSSVKIFASVGRDAYRDMPSKCLLNQDVTALGTSKDTAATLKSASSRLLSAGVEAKDGVTPRIKSISSQIPAGGASYVKLTVYDGNTAVWQKTTATAAYVSATQDSASPNSVRFPEAKGISATKGNSIVAVATTDANLDSDTVAKAIANVAIVYDQYRD